MKVERLETSSKEKSQKKKFSKRASSSSGKRARDVQAESVQGSATRGRRQGGTTVSSAFRGASVGQGEISECTHFHRRHSGVCRLLIGGCFRCGSLEHLIAQCPRDSGDNKEVAEEDIQHHFRLESEVGVVVAHLGIEDEEAQFHRQWIVLCLQHQHEHML